MKNIIKNLIFVFVLVAVSSIGTSFAFAAVSHPSINISPTPSPTPIPTPIVINNLPNATLSSSPTIVSASATSITQTSATLTGVINPNGDTTTAWFETPSGGPFQTQNLGNGNSNTSMASYSLTGLTAGTSYTFRIIAGNINGPMIGNWVHFTTLSSGGSGGGGGGGGGGYSYYNPSVTTESATSISNSSATLNGLVNPRGYSSTTAWFEYGTSSNLAVYSSTNPLSEGSANVDLSLVQSITNLAPNTTYYFRAVASNSYSTIKGSIFALTTSTNALVNTASETVTTVQAINKTSTSARLSGIFLNQDGISAQGYFQYGTSSSLGLSTAAVNLGVIPSLTFADTAKNLTPGTIYYFRAVALKQGVTYNGNILVFKTANTNDSASSNTDLNDNPPSTDNGPTINTDNDVQGSIIQITTDKKDVAENDEINYLVTFQNNTSENFENAKVTIQLPEGIDFESSNFGKKEDNNTVVFDAGVLIPNQVESMTVIGKVNSKVSPQNILVTTAIMSYNTPSSITEKDEIAYVTNNVVINAEGLAANSLFGASFLPSTLLGWLALILVILALSIVSRKIFINRSTKKLAPKTADHIEDLPM